MKQWLRSCSLVALALGPSLPAAAAPIFDQNQLLIDLTVGGAAVGGGPNSEQKLAQVITAGLSGLLTEVLLPIGGFGELTVEIQGVTDDLPNGVVLASNTFASANFPPSFPDPPPFHSLAFSKPAFFTAGDRFAVILSSPDDFGVFSGPIGDPYPGGQAFFDARPNPAGVWEPLGDRMDLPFQTIVEPTVVPEPALLALFVMAVGGRAAISSRRT